MKSVKSASVLIAAFTLVSQHSFADATFSAPTGNLMSWDNAKTYCDTPGSHLPSAREIAAYASSRGAQGIKETSYPGGVTTEPEVKAEIIGMAAQGYQLVQKPSFWAPLVDFYYSADGFQGDQQMGSSGFWTATSLPGGMLSQNKEKITLSNADGSLGSDLTNSGRNQVLCSTETISAPPAGANGSGLTTVSINPTQISFKTDGKTLSATISDSNGKKIEDVALDTSNLGRDESNVETAKNYCADIAAKAASSNQKITLDVSYVKLEKFCTIGN